MLYIDDMSLHEPIICSIFLENAVSDAKQREGRNTLRNKQFR